MAQPRPRFNVIAELPLPPWRPEPPEEDGGSGGGSGSAGPPKFPEPPIPVKVQSCEAGLRLRLLCTGDAFAICMIQCEIKGGSPSKCLHSCRKVGEVGAGICGTSFLLCEFVVGKWPGRLLNCWYPKWGP
jgi:hypothetical protein